MYCVYETRSLENTFNIIGFCNTQADANNIIIDDAKKYVVFEEGAKKLDNVWITKDVAASTLKDGIYFIKNDDVKEGVFIKVVKKLTSKIIISGWVTVSENIDHKFETIKYYGFSKFDKSLLSNVVDVTHEVKHVTKTVQTEKPVVFDQKHTNMSKVILELQNAKFRPKPYTKHRKTVSNESFDFA